MIRYFKFYVVFILWAIVLWYCNLHFNDNLFIGHMFNIIIQERNP